MQLMPGDRQRVMDRFVDRRTRRSGCHEGHGGTDLWHPCRPCARSIGPGYFLTQWLIASLTISVKGLMLTFCRQLSFPISNYSRLGAAAAEVSLQDIKKN